MEELAYADVNVANAVIPVLLITALISQHGPEAMRAHWLPRLAAGEAYVAFGLTEPGSGSDAAALRTEAAADDRGYLISGEKTSVTMLAHADAMIVTARTRRDGHRACCPPSWSGWTGTGSPPRASMTAAGARWAAAACTSTRSGWARMR